MRAAGRRDVIRLAIGAAIVPLLTARRASAHRFGLTNMA